MQLPDGTSIGSFTFSLHTANTPGGYSVSLDRIGLSLPDEHFHPTLPSVSVTYGKQFPSRDW